MDVIENVCVTIHPHFFPYKMVAVVSKNQQYSDDWQNKRKNNVPFVYQLKFLTESCCEKEITHGNKCYSKVRQLREEFFLLHVARAKFQRIT